MYMIVQVCGVCESNMIFLQFCYPTVEWEGSNKETSNYFVNAWVKEKKTQGFKSTKYCPTGWICLQPHLIKVILCAFPTYRSME